MNNPEKHSLHIAQVFGALLRHAFSEHGKDAWI